MNYYEHHLGDYLRDTAHLSMLEDGAYRRLLDVYYVKEQPIPADLKDACRIARAASKPERDAVAVVLREFFEFGLDGWRHKRCDAEISRFKDKQMKAKRSANARWGAPEAHSEGNANASPNADADDMRTHSEGNAPQSPVTRHHTQTPETKGAPELRAGEACQAMKQAGLQAANPGHPRLIALIAAGITTAELADAASAAAQGGKGFAYALATAEGRRREAAAITALPAARNAAKGGYAAQRNRAFAGEFADDAHLIVDEENRHDIALPHARR